MARVGKVRALGKSDRSDPWQRRGSGGIRDKAKAAPCAMGVVTRPKSNCRWCAHSEVSGITCSGYLQFTRPTGDGHDLTAGFPKHWNSVRISLVTSRGLSRPSRSVGLPAIRLVALCHTYSTFLLGVWRFGAPRGPETTRGAIQSARGRRASAAIRGHHLLGGGPSPGSRGERRARHALGVRRTVAHSLHWGSSCWILSPRRT